MAAVTSFGAVFNTTAGNKTVTATPAAGDLIIVLAGNSGRTLAQAPVITDDNGGGGGGYSLVTAATNNSSADSMWVFVRNSPIRDAASTIVTMAQSLDTGGGFQAWRVSGMSRYGQTAVRQVAIQSNQGAGGTPTPVFPVAALTTNPLMTGVLNTTNANIAAPSGWAASANGGYATPATGINASTRDSGFTSATVTWGGTSTTGFASIAVELDTTAYAPVLPVDAPFIYMRQSN